MLIYKRFIKKTLVQPQPRILCICLKKNEKGFECTDNKRSLESIERKKQQNLYVV